MPPQLLQLSGCNMDIIDISLSQLVAHPLNSNVMERALFRKLVEHVHRTDRYPPVIVRPLKGAAGQGAGSEVFQILDGHHRVAALRELSRSAARCVVWDVDDDEASLLLATLNRLQGQDDPRKRAVLVATLQERGATLAGLAQALPERIEQLESLLRLSRPPEPARPPRALDELPVAVHFFLTPVQRSALNARLRELGGTREEALMRLVTP